MYLIDAFRPGTPEVNAYYLFLHLIFLSIVCVNAELQGLPISEEAKCSNVGAADVFGGRDWGARPA